MQGKLGAYHRMYAREDAEFTAVQALSLEFAKSFGEQGYGAGVQTTCP